MAFPQPLRRLGLALVLFFFLGEVWTDENILECPSACFCDTKNVDYIPGGQGLKINCHPTLSASNTFDIRLPTNTIQLDLAKYGIRHIASETFKGLVHLQKLDLQGNNIEKIEDGAFRILPKLEILDLSRNALTKIDRETLAGLVSLKRLRLADNNVNAIDANSFDNLQNLEKVRILLSLNILRFNYWSVCLFQVDISQNPFVCDCNLRWLSNWLTYHPSSLINAAKTRCALPISVADEPLKEVLKRSIFNDCKADLLTSVPPPPSASVPNLYEESRRGGTRNEELSKREINISPSHSQVAFEGDELSFHCQASDWLGTPQWLVNGNVLSSDSESIQVTSATGHTVLSISKLDPAFKGQVSCQVSDGSKISVDILVLPRDAPVCHPISLETSRGQYRWSASVAGTVLSQWCQRKPEHGQDSAQAMLECRQTGEWAASVNVSECAYTSEVTDTLHKFATMDTSFTMSTLLDSAKHFLNYTSEPRMFQNPMDVVYFSRAVENYLPFLRDSSDVGHYMMDMIGNILGVSPRLLNEAQRRGLACGRLLNVMENITDMAVPAFRHDYDSTLALETFFIKPGFEGVSCAWYERQDYSPYSSKRVFHCMPNNHSISSSPGKLVLASVILPASLSKHIDYQLISSPYSSRDGQTVRLMMAAFDNSSLFPSQWMTSPVIGCTVIGSQRNLNLTDPVRASIQVDSDLRSLYDVTPVFWDQYAEGGFGAWNQDVCQIKGELVISKDLIEFVCSRVGFYALKYDLKGFSGVELMSSKWHHPILYVCGSIAGFLLLFTFIVFASKGVSVRMTYELRHAFMNLWLTSLLLLYFYLMGIYQVDSNHEATCRIVAFTLHHLMISSLFWILIGVFMIYDKVSQRDKKNTPPSVMMDGFLVRGQESKRQPISNNPTRLSASGNNMKTLMKYYFVGYGIPTLVVLLTVSASMKSYQNGQFCFLSSGSGNGHSLGPLIGGLVVPCVLISTVMIGFALSILCVLSASPYKITEADESEMRQKLKLLDGCQSPKHLLLSLVAQCFLLIASIILAGLQLVLPSYLTLTSLAVSITLLFYSLFVVLTFCFLRRDVFGFWQKSCPKPENSSPDHDDLTANLVELCPRPLPQHATNSSERTSSLRPPPLKDKLHLAPRETAVIPSPASGFYGPVTKMNSLNIHSGLAENLPKTSSPANSQVPYHDQDLTVSPLFAGVTERPTEAYSVVPLTYQQPPPPQEISLASVKTGFSYTDSSTIKMSGGCDMATFDFGLQQPSSVSLIGTGTPKRLLNMCAPHSSSLPRLQRHRAQQAQSSRPSRESRDDLLETQSKYSALSMNSSRSGHSRSGRKRHKKPNRRRPRGQTKEQSKDTTKEPVYNNVDEEYHGDDDHFDTLERNRRTIALPDELPSVIHEMDGDEDEDGDSLPVEDELSQGREEPASLDDLPPPSSSPTAEQFDLPKRETSV